MGSQLKTEDILMQIRSKLQNDNIKLWLEPYYYEGIGSCEEELATLSNRYAAALNISQDNCLYALKELQEFALEKLKERDHFKNTGIATLKVRIPTEGSGPRVHNIEIKLDVISTQLKSEISQRTNIDMNRFKMIAGGRVLVDNKSLQSQGIKNGSQIMVVLLHDNPDEISEMSKNITELESIKADTKLLASKSDQYYMNVEDQFGNSVNLPPQEKKALLVAMALHEKGRKALKKCNYSLALVMFLDADKEFSQCNSSILDLVDNYALLNLDIVWCYLCLKSISQIPEAEERLQKCEKSFIRSYGQNMERVIALKGTPGNEQALFMRLHLLQAIVKYYQNKRGEALNLLMQSEQELRLLKVDENSIMTLVELGYSVAEARIGLRATQGNVNAAAEYINSNREKRKESRKKTLEEWSKNKEKYKLGKCADGKQYVEPKFLEMMVTMGYPKETARRALQQSNNNVSMSVQIIQDNPDMLNLVESNSLHSLSHVVDDMIPHLEEAGFNINAVREALQSHSGDVLKAIDELLSAGSTTIQNSDGIVDELNSTNSSSTFDSDSSGPSGLLQDVKDKQKELEAYERLTEVIPTADDDHLDLSLEQEELFLSQYKSLLMSD